ncbi:MAG: hypothetical protein PHU42_01255 [Patescibacteria group bacterium]|nr:hypothetical protein [Patescibacteria group bacterium]
MKKCPHCAEEVKDEAVICKHCHTDLNKTTEKKIEVVAKEGMFLQSMNGCCGVILVIIGVIVGLAIIGFVGGLIMANIH